MVELRKRKAPPPPPAVQKKLKSVPKPKSASKPKETATSVSTQSTTTATTKVPRVDDVLDLEGFGGEIETNEGTQTNLKKLVEESKAGVVLFTYPRASTPGCTKQACLFRDNHEYLTSTGLAIYGLSADSPKANTNFQTKQRLPYPLLCDSNSSLIGAIGFKKAPKGTTRGVFAVDKQGKVLLCQPGGPDATVDAVQQLVALSSTKTTQNEVDDGAK